MTPDPFRGESGSIARSEVSGARARPAMPEVFVNSDSRRGAEGELWQARFFDRALRTVKEYNEKVEYIHMNPVRPGLVSRPQDWRWSSFNEYAGTTSDEQKQRCGLVIDRVRMPSDPRTRI